MTLISFRQLASITLLVLLLSPAALLGQGSSVGTITGVVTDPSGGTIPGVLVSVRNVNTNFLREMNTGTEGVYTISNLPVGKYSLRAVVTGFQTAEVTEIVLDVNATLRVDVRLTVGQVSETVSVQAAAPLLNTENAGTGQVVEQKRITELPLNGRDFQQPQLLVPGSVTGYNFQTSLGLSSGASVLNTNTTLNVANGGRPGSTLFTIDGASATNQAGRGLIQTPAIDELQEFKVQTSNMSAEFGYGGSAVNVSIKSGTNELHGVAYEFLRNQALDARSFSATRREALKRNQFGANAGGPVLIPKLYNGRDRTFWFFSYEGLRLRQGTSKSGTVPTELMRTGDLSEWTNALYGPSTTQSNGAGGYVRDIFPNKPLSSPASTNPFIQGLVVTLERVAEDYGFPWPIVFVVVR